MANETKECDVLPPIISFLKMGMIDDAVSALRQDPGAAASGINGRNGWTALHYAAAKGSAVGGQRFLDAILDAGAYADIHVLTKDGRTALQLACGFSDEETAAKLIGVGADMQAGKPSAADILKKNGEKKMLKRLKSVPVGKRRAVEPEGSASGGMRRGSVGSLLGAMDAAVLETKRSDSSTGRVTSTSLNEAKFNHDDMQLDV